MKYPYKYEKVSGGVRIHATPEISTQLLSIAKELYGNDPLNGVIFTGHWYVQIRRESHAKSMQHAKKVTKLWRQRHNKSFAGERGEYENSIRKLLSMGMLVEMLKQGIG